MHSSSGRRIGTRIAGLQQSPTGTPPSWWPIFGFLRSGGFNPESFQTFRHFRFQISNFRFRIIIFHSKFSSTPSPSVPTRSIGEQNKTNQFLHAQPSSTSRSFCRWPSTSSSTSTTSSAGFARVAPLQFRPRAH